MIALYFAIIIQNRSCGEPPSMETKGNCNYSHEIIIIVLQSVNYFANYLVKKGQIKNNFKQFKRPLFL